MKTSPWFALLGLLGGAIIATCFLVGTHLSFRVYNSFVEVSASDYETIYSWWDHKSPYYKLMVRKALENDGWISETEYMDIIRNNNDDVEKQKNIDALKNKLLERVSGDGQGGVLGQE